MAEVDLARGILWDNVDLYDGVLKANIDYIMGGIFAAAGGPCVESTENFLIYTEVDPSSKITVDSSTKVSWVGHISSDDSWVIAHKGLNFYNGDYTCTFETQFSNQVSAGTVGQFCLANIIGSNQDIVDATGDCHRFTTGADGQFFIQIVQNGSATGRQDNTVAGALTPGTTYFITMDFVYSTRVLTCTIRTVSHEGEIFDTLAVTGTEDHPFRYLYAMHSRGAGADTIDGFVQNMTITTNELCGNADRGMFGGGQGPTNVIQYITISTLGNATDFGDLTLGRYNLYSCSNGGSDRGIWAGGYNSGTKNNIDYVTISTPGDASDFGDLIVALRRSEGTSNGVNDRGVFCGGKTNNIIEYITISTTSDSTDFGDLTQARQDTASCSNDTNERAITGGGSNDPESVLYNTIDYITISTPGDATDFGDLTVGRRTHAAVSNGTEDRGVFCGGWDSGGDSNVMDYVTISSTGNATDFGDLYIDARLCAGLSNKANQRGIIGGDFNANVIHYFTIDTLADSLDFGNLTTNRYQLAGCSNA